MLIFEKGFDLRLFDEGENLSTEHSESTQIENNESTNSQTINYESLPKLKNLERYKKMFGLVDESSTQTKPDAQGENKEEQTEVRQQQNNNVDNQQPNEDKATEDKVTEEKQKTEEERKADYIKFKEQYKDLFEADFKYHLDRRFKKYDGIKEQLNAISPLVEVLQQKYNTDNIYELTNIVRNEVYNELAELEGIPIEQYTKIKQLEEQNKRFEEWRRQEQEQAVINQKVNRWYQEEQEVKQIYPDFNLREYALQNERFLDLIIKDVPVKTAYEICNQEYIQQKKEEEIKRKAQEEAERILKEQMIKNRPMENGLYGNQSASISKIDPKKLSAKERLEIAARVKRGEKFTF